MAKTKIVIRRLPPLLPERIFTDVIKEYLCYTDYYLYVSGKANTGIKPSVHSRAYLNFNSMEKLVEFKVKFDGWKFQSKSGEVHFAVVEFAPSQALPKNRKDELEGSYEADFMAFVKELETSGLPSTQEKEETEMDKGETPLLKYLRENSRGDASKRDKLKQKRKERKKKSKEKQKDAGQNKQGGSSSFPGKPKSDGQGKKNNHASSKSAADTFSGKNSSNPSGTSATVTSNGTNPSTTSKNSRSARGRGRGRGGQNNK